MRKISTAISYMPLVILACILIMGLMIPGSVSLPNLSVGLKETSRLRHLKKEYAYGQWENASKVKGMELLVLDGDNKLFDSFQHVDKYETPRQASRGFFGRFAGSAEHYRPPPVKNWWAVAGIGDLCMIELPRGWDPGDLGPERYEEDLAKNTLRLPLEEHYAIEECKMGNLVLACFRVNSLKGRWDIARRIDKIFYEPVSLSSSVPNLTWSLKRRPFSGWLLTLDQVPKDSLYFLQGTGLTLKRMPGEKGEVVISILRTETVTLPSRSAEIRTKWFSSKRELLVSVDGPDHQKQTIKVDLGKSSLDWLWFLPRLAGVALLVWGGLRLWRRRDESKKGKYSHPIELVLSTATEKRGSEIK